MTLAGRNRQLLNGQTLACVRGCFARVLVARSIPAPFALTLVGAPHASLEAVAVPLLTVGAPAATLDLVRQLGGLKSGSVALECYAHSHPSNRFMPHRAVVAAVIAPTPEAALFFGREALAVQLQALGLLAVAPSEVAPVRRAVRGWDRREAHRLGAIQAWHDDVLLRLAPGYLRFCPQKKEQVRVVIRRLRFCADGDGNTVGSVAGLNGGWALIFLSLDRWLCSRFYFWAHLSLERFVVAVFAPTTGRAGHPSLKTFAIVLLASRSFAKATIHR